MEGRFSGVSFGFALQLSFDKEKFECFRIGLSFKQDTFHKSRERKGGGDLILVVRIFMRGVSVRSFVYFLVSVYFLSLFKRYSTDVLTSVGGYRSSATNGLSMQMDCLQIEK